MSPLPPPSRFTPGLDPPQPEPPRPIAAAGRYVILKGNKLLEGSVRLAGDKVVVRQGALDRPFPQNEVLAVVNTPEEVRQWQRQRIAEDDLAGRLALARWLMFNGLREQALAEARAILERDPSHRASADLARSLELSLQQFPPAGQSPRVEGTLATAWAEELQLTAEGAATFLTRAQPVLANQCMDCHARPDYAGPFKLVRVQGFEAGQQATQANLRAVAAQLDRQEPLRSPLLVQALTPHGGRKEPVFLNRQAGGYKVLESWVLSAVPPPAPPMIPPAVPDAAPAPPMIPPADALPAAPPAVLTPPPAVPMGSSPAVPPVPPSVPAPPPVPSVPVPPPAGASPPVPVPPSATHPLPAGQPSSPPVPPHRLPPVDEFDPTPFHQGQMPLPPAPPDTSAHPRPPAADER